MAAASLIYAALLGLSCCCLVVAQTLSTTPISVNPQTSQLIDEHGREVYFHGANVVVKGFPWAPETDHFDPETSFSKKDMEMLRELGLNGIRLGTMWPGAEPTRGAFNASYLQRLYDLVEAAGEYGIYSLLDMHQDLMSEKFCGEGFPLWASVPNTTNFPYPLQKTPYNVSSNGIPTKAECDSRGWFAYYFTEAVAGGFGNFYENYDGIQDAWVKFWKTVATKMKPLGAAVLGYELINEPWAGDEYKQPALMVPSITDHKYLQPAYDKAAKAIREVDTSHAIFFEGVTWDWLWSGFTDVPGGKDWRNKSVLSYHFYIPPDFSIDVQFDARTGDQKRLKCGGFLTEFGVARCAGCGNVEPEKVMDACDKHKQSWLFWEYKPFVGYRTGHSNSVWFANGTVNAAVAFNVSRTYARVVAGHTNHTKFDIKSGRYDLSFTVAAAVTNPSSYIYVSEKYHYPNGLNATATTVPATFADRVMVNATRGTNTVEVVYDAATVPVGTVIYVAIVAL